MAQTAMNGIGGLVGSLSSLPTTYSLCGQLAGMTHRCAQLIEALDELQVVLRFVVANWFMLAL